MDHLQRKLAKICHLWLLGMFLLPNASLARTGFFQLIANARVNNSCPASLGDETSTPSPLVTMSDLERNFAELEQMDHVSPNGGVFGPESVVWTVAGVDVLDGFSLVISEPQSLNPGAAMGVWEHSDLKKDPVGRLRRTVRKLNTMIFGTFEEASRLAVGLHRGHSYVTGTMEHSSGFYNAGQTYSANESLLLLWVHTTHWWGLYEAYNALVRPLSSGETRQYFEETVKAGMLMGLNKNVIPSTEGEYLSFFSTMAHSGALSSRADNFGKYQLDQLLKPMIRDVVQNEIENEVYRKSPSVVMVPTLIPFVLAPVPNLLRGPGAKAISGALAPSILKSGEAIAAKHIPYPLSELNSFQRNSSLYDQAMLYLRSGVNTYPEYDQAMRRVGR